MRTFVQYALALLYAVDSTAIWLVHQEYIGVPKADKGVQRILQLRLFVCLLCFVWIMVDHW